ncbi:unnamed protein product [Heligmosomoides polygyrus]|uniref:DDE-1 domain-containing protein n=1 Tax=Heligmosomoides polygyrus TaxID=6339 RepID=A0A183G596_HELPZ|nr:unnamed protein product [Heligmosomoides polygyrus]
MENKEVSQLSESTSGNESYWTSWFDRTHEIRMLSKSCRKPRVPFIIGYHKDTFCDYLNGSRKSIFLASVMFVDDLGKLEERARHCGVSRNTMTQWDQWFRDVIVESQKIGGANRII